MPFIIAKHWRAARSLSRVFLESAPEVGDAEEGERVLVPRGGRCKLFCAWGCEEILDLQTGELVQCGLRRATTLQEEANVVMDRIRRAYEGNVINASKCRGSAFEVQKLPGGGLRNSAAAARNISRARGPRARIMGRIQRDTW